MFSIVLVNIQGGLFVGLVRRAGLLVDHGNADIWVGHRLVHNVDFPEDIPLDWIHRVRSAPGVQTAEPYVIGWSTMTLPSGGFESVVVVGSEPSTSMGGAWNVVEGAAIDVLAPDGVIVDRCEDEKIEYPAIGDSREIGGHRARIVAKTHGIVGFLVAPYVFTTTPRALDFLGKPDGVCSYYLVRTAPDADVAKVVDEISRRIPELDVFASDDYSQTSIDFWMKRTGLGISFGAATMLGLLVGLVMVGQTLYASVLDRLGEFGTLKAMGAKDVQIYSVLLVQAVTMALAGTLIGLFLVAILQSAFSTPKAPIVIPLWLSLGSSLLVLGICLASSALPYYRVRRLDPMMVLQS